MRVHSFPYICKQNRSVYNEPDTDSKHIFCFDSESCNVGSAYKSRRYFTPHWYMSSDLIELKRKTEAIKQLLEVNNICMGNCMAS